MSVHDIKKYRSILVEAHISQGGKMSKLEANYTDFAPSKETQCRHCTNFMSPNKCYLVEGLISPNGYCDYYEAASLEEKWDEPTKVSPSERGEYKGKSKAELLKTYNALKKSGPHKRGSPEFGRMRELAFAIRAKSNWGDIPGK